MSPRTVNDSRGARGAALALKTAVGAAVLTTTVLNGCVEPTGAGYAGSHTGAAIDSKALSAGDLTVFTSSVTAYDTPTEIVAGNSKMYKRFLRGDVLWERPRVANPADIEGTGGLGPLYTGYSCASCHQGAGRTKSTLFTHGGTGVGFSSFLVFIRTPNGEYFREYGRVLHDQATYGAEPEGKLRVTYTEKCYEFPDGEQYCLITPHYTITDWYATEIPEAELIMSVRTPCRQVGLGPMMALDRNELRKLAGIDYPEYGISGELNWIPERGRWHIGVSGLKAQHADLTVELGFLSNMGVTNDRFPDEVAEGQPQVTEDFGIEVTMKDMADVDYYLHNLGVPARRNVGDPEVRRGEEMFYRAKCHLCHTPTLHTGPEPPTLIDGTALPHLTNQTIHPYSDFQLHDMGPELGDDYDQFNASGDEWRTAPLWGIGLQMVVNGHMHLLHDGRARTFVEAIMWHKGGEGDVSYQLFRKMKKTDRDALVRFLKSL